MNSTASPRLGASAAPPLVLRCRRGGVLEPIELAPDSGPAVIGRSSRCRIPLRELMGSSDDLLVSREHALVEHRNGQWWITDLSRHGTILNGMRMPAAEPMPLRARDHIRIGGWSFDVQIGGADESESRDTSIATVDRAGEASRVRRIDPATLGQLARDRLRVFLACVEQAQQAEDEQAMYQIILRAAIDGSGYSRSALIRPEREGEEVTVLAAAPSAEGFRCSRTLVRAAAAGSVALLSPETPSMAVSIDSHQIRHALCAPIIVDGVVDSLLYLDSRSTERPPHADAAAFCDGLAHFAALARADLHRKRLQRSQRLLERELEIAQTIQTHLLPPATGEAHGVRYAMRLLPGRQIAGDLFDVIPLADGQVAFCIGDVAGAGVGPGLLMGVTLAHLRAALGRSPSGSPSQSLELESAVNGLNEYLCAKTPGNVFTSLWIGIIDPARRVCRAIDAGHGHWLLWRNGRCGDQMEAGPRHLPLGIDAAARYAATEFPFLPGDRLVLYSDGVVECRRRRDGEIEFFGRPRVEEAIRPSTSASDDVERIIQAMRAFCDAGELNDDTTVASIEYAS